ncbi:glycosyl transferase family 4 [Candidatus Pacearchaeota archaeon]|jgi:UDP-N-acetylglucosamine--dolichyl-phosphate N-acetylglucosaminephosphotransferase|nr:glycosyl transferase family 4 [Candidatus Pacearchaeota archaeon]|tara:strand:- start:13562 stop:14557 length:996 start_codon:yes stop_codon:yes gene_type:complete
MEPLLIIPLILSFLVTLFFTPIWIKKAKEIGLIWEDMNKKNYPKNVAGSGGIVVTFGFILGVLIYIAIKTFYFNSTENLIEVFIILTSISIISSVGLIDDLFGWQKGGLSKKSRLILILLAAIPLMVINAGESEMMGIEFGLFYPLLLIPLGIVGATATYNFLAGYNGLETSQGILILLALSFITWVTGSSWLSLISLIMVFSLVAFYIYNKYPAKVFPGDILTYSIGSLIAIIAILGNIEKITIFLFIPYIIETGLKLRGKLKKDSFAKLDKDGSLEVPYDKFYGIEHIAIYLLKKIKKKVYEKDVVYLINAFQILIIILAFILFGKEIF